MRKSYLLLVICILCCVLGACGKKEIAEEQSENITEVYEEKEENSVEQADDSVEAETDNEEVRAEETADIEEEAQEEILEEEAETVPPSVDLIMFMGQSNMSGCGGDASIAPFVLEEAGQEFRAISDPTKLYPIKEPFGINENNINGIIEKPGGKKGSLVSAFVNEYYAETGVPVVAVSASLGETDLDKWLSESMSVDALTRYIAAKNWLSDNGYNVNHRYIVWLQGESDALKKTSKDAYKTKMDDFIRPFFMEGMDKVFIITPGRTIDATEIYSQIISAQQEMCMDSGYYALATSVLSGVSCEYMTDIYHYNQHVLNLVGIEAAKSVAYYTNTGHEMVVYNYKKKEIFVPSGSEGDMGEANGPIELDNLNERY